MKRKLNVALKNLDGTNITEATVQQLEVGKAVVQSLTVMTASIACGNALTQLFEDERSLSGVEKHKRGKLAQRVFDAEGEIDLSAEEITTIKTCVGKHFNPLVVAQIYDILESDPVGDDNA